MSPRPWWHLSETARAWLIGVAAVSLAWARWRGAGGRPRQSAVVQRAAVTWQRERVDGRP